MGSGRMLCQLETLSTLWSDEALGSFLSPVHIRGSSPPIGRDGVLFRSDIL